MSAFDANRAGHLDRHERKDKMDFNRADRNNDRALNRQEFR